MANVPKSCHEFRLTNQSSSPTIVTTGRVNLPVATPICILLIPINQKRLSAKFVYALSYVPCFPVMIEKNKRNFINRIQCLNGNISFRIEFSWLPQMIVPMLHLYWLHKNLQQSHVRRLLRPDHLSTQYLHGIRYYLR